MAERIWLGGVGDWFVIGNWQTIPPDPNSYPLPGDIVTITAGTADISAADVSRFGMLDGEQVTLGAGSATDPATIEADGASFGSAFTLATAGYGRILTHGTVSYDGAITVAARCQLTVALPDQGAAPSFVLGTDGSIDASGGGTVAIGPGDATSAGSFINNGTISASAGGFVTVAKTTGFTNNGVITASMGGAFQIDTGGTLTNDGTINAFGGAVSIDSGATLAGTGTFQLKLGSTLAFGEDTRQTFIVPATQTITFLDDNATLGIGDPADFQGQITGFQAGDRIDLYNPNKADSVAYDQATGTLTITFNGAPVGTLHLTGSVDPGAFSVHFTGGGNTVITSSDATRTWTGGTGDWFDAANWSTPAPDPANYPLGGDTVILGSGTAHITTADWAAHGVLDWEQITLGSATQGTPAELQTDGGTFGSSVTIGTGTNSEYAALEAHGTTIFNGTIIGQGQGGRFTIDAASNGATANFILSSTGTVIATQESSVYLAGGTFTNLGTILVDGDVTIDAGATLAGDGGVLVQAGGVLIADGAVAASEVVQFADDTGTLRIADLSAFAGSVSGFVHGDAVDLTGITATSATYDASTNELQLYDGGSQVGRLHIDDPYGNGASDFALRSDGGQGTLITTATDGPLQVLLPTTPLPLVASAGDTVPLSQILTAAFGSVPAGYQSYAVNYLGAQWLADNNFKYWTPPGSDAVNAWYINGVQVPAGLPATVQDAFYTPADQIGDIALKVGNNIAPVAFITVPVASGPNGPTEYIRYDVPVVDPAVMSPTAGDGTPDPSDIVASALRFALHYTAVLNNDDCGYIADDVAAAAGATMPQQDGSTDPDRNVSGGFWRVVYRGSDTPNPVRDWFTLTQPGDVVRMGKLGASGHHTTTVVGTINPDGSLPVYDNADVRDNVNYIGLHNATYWTGTDPAMITIYRLDPYHQYLITGTSQDEVIQGSTFNNLIQPGGGQDVITAGNANNEIQDTTAHLSGVTVTDYHVGDTIDFTDLAAAGASVAYNAGSGTLQVFQNGQRVAVLHLGGGLTGQPFFTTPDGNGGTIVTAAPVDLDQYGSGAGLVKQALSPLGATGRTTHLVTAASSAVPDAIAGQYNISWLTGATPGTPVFLPSGYRASFLAGNADATLIDPGQGNAVLVANTGNDVLAANGSSDVLVGNIGDDLLFGGPGGSVLLGGGGADTLVAGTGSSTLVGGAGNNSIFTRGSGLVVTGNGDNLVAGPVAGGGAYTVIAGDGNDTVSAGSGNYAINAGGGANLVYLGTGDTLAYAPGADTIVAGAGNDTVALAGSAALVFGDSGQLAVGGGSSSTVVAGAGASTLFGGQDNTYYLGAGPTLYSNGAGANTIVGGQGASTLFGGSGSTVVFEGAGPSVFVGGAGAATVVGAQGATSLFGGSGGSIVFSGEADGNVLVAGDGNETLSAASSTGANTMVAESGTDLLFGGAGNDTIIGGTGSATVSGGQGADCFAFFDGSAGGNVTITDFTPGEDKLVFNAYGATSMDAITGQDTTGGSTTITLSDNTHITLLGVTDLQGSAFI